MTLIITLDNCYRIRTDWHWLMHRVIDNNQIFIYSFIHHFATYGDYGGIGGGEWCE